jgi:hypothetical protein
VPYVAEMAVGVSAAAVVKTTGRYVPGHRDLFADDTAMTERETPDGRRMTPLVTRSNTSLLLLPTSS